MRRAVVVAIALVTTLPATACKWFVYGPSPDERIDIPVDASIPEAARPVADAAVLDCPELHAVSAADFDGARGWRPAGVRRGACTEADLAQWRENIHSPESRNFDDLARGVGGECNACLFTSFDAPEWGLIVEDERLVRDEVFYNPDACFAALEGDPCGKAHRYEGLCLDSACADCAGWSPADEQCRMRARTTAMCAPFVTATASACPDLAATSGRCNDPVEAARALCGPKDADAG